jgi:hypothetical protein
MGAEASSRGHAEVPDVEHLEDIVTLEDAYAELEQCVHPDYLPQTHRAEFKKNLLVEAKDLVRIARYMLKASAAPELATGEDLVREAQGLFDKLDLKTFLTKEDENGNVIVNARQDNAMMDQMKQTRKDQKAAVARRDYAKADKCKGDLENLVWSLTEKKAAKDEAEQVESARQISQRLRDYVQQLEIQIQYATRREEFLLASDLRTVQKGANELRQPLLLYATRFAVNERKLIKPPGPENSLREGLDH